MSLTNLLKETLDDLEAHNKSPSDVRWVGSIDGEAVMLWKDFVEIANVDYDSGYGSAEICTDLVVVGDDWWLERSEYDGAEGWDYHTLPLIRSGFPSRFTKVKGYGWDSLSEINKEGYTNDYE